MLHLLRQLRPKKQSGMGFKDMMLFNQALLACEAWRLIQFPDSLCEHFVRTKILPIGNLIDAVFPENLSSTWHAIEYGLRLLKTGVLWWIDKWCACADIVWSMDTSGSTNEACITGAMLPYTVGIRAAKFRWVTKQIASAPALSADGYRG
jgi:hypothetical protein